MLAIKYLWMILPAGFYSTALKSHPGFIFTPVRRALLVLLQAADKFPSSCFKEEADIGVTPSKLRKFKCSFNNLHICRAMRKKGSPGHTATADYMAELSQRNNSKVPYDIEFGDEPQPAMAPRRLTSSQLQVSYIAVKVKKITNTGTASLSAGLLRV